MKPTRELRSPSFWKIMLSEFIATTLYSFIANTLCHTIDSKTTQHTECSRARQSSGMLLAATGIGLSVATLSYVFRTHSHTGCYMNPAVSFGQFTCWRFSFVKTFFLLLMQMSGGIAGVAISYTVRKDHGHTYLGITPDNMSTTEGVIGQFIPSFLIVMVVLTTSDERRGQKGVVMSLMYGVVCMMAVLVAGQHSECAINPARILGLAIVLNRWTHPIWIYWVGSVAGGILAGVVYQLLFRNHYPEETMNTRPPSRNNNFPFNNSNNSSTHKLSRDKILSPVPFNGGGGGGVKPPGMIKSRTQRICGGGTGFWKRQGEMVPFIRDDTLTKNTVM